MSAHIVQPSRICFWARSAGSAQAGQQAGCRSCGSAGLLRLPSVGGCGAAVAPTDATVRAAWAEAAVARLRAGDTGLPRSKSAPLRAVA